MTRETTNTTGYDLKPEAHYTLEVEKVIKKSIGKEGGKQWPGYEWTLDIRDCDVDLEDNNLKIFMFKSQMGDLLRRLDAKETSPDVFEWETEEMKGKIFDCHLVHIDINGKKREALIEIKKSTAEVSAPKKKEAVAWDE